FCTMIPIPRCY
uniref:Tigerinin-1 n=1 Tax=Hoplobatrachus tigerinus TaxID=103373 RepID=TIN1_HOPTI|nr:RecName: Full=Tigerinin-1 [Hoplobatrachus tigerinus]